MIAFMWIFAALTSVCWFYSWSIFARLKKVPCATKNPRPPVTISIIIPARNEELNLANLIPSITKQKLDFVEVIVVDDDSEDATADIAAKNGATVVRNPPLPEGWLGKQWACVNGAKTATGDWLLFLDADTVLLPGSLERMAHLTRDSDAVHSICPDHRVEQGYEQWSAFFNAVMVAGSNAFTIRGDRADSIGMFGQAMLVKQSDYDRIGGHGSVKWDVTDHFVMAQKFDKIGIPRRCYLGRGTITMRMYPKGFSELINGWAKSFVSGAGATPKSALIAISIWLSGLMTASISLSFLPLAPKAVLWFVLGNYIAFAIQCLYVFRRIGTFSLLNGLFFPVSLAFYQWLFFRSLIRSKGGESVFWKGRDVS